MDRIIGRVSCGLALSLATLATGCALAPTAVPAAVPAPAAEPAAAVSYEGVLDHRRPGLGQPTGWVLHNQNAPGGLPVDVSKVTAKATALAGKLVVVTAHSADGPANTPVLVATDIVAAPTD
jgi:hypothetical protein